MGIGASVLLIAVGAIFAFAVEFELGFVDIAVVGWILMIAGAVGLVVTLSLWGRSRRTRVVQRNVYPDQGVPGRSQRVVEDRYDEPGAPPPPV